MAEIEKAQQVSPKRPTREVALAPAKSVLDRGADTSSQRSFLPPLSRSTCVSGPAKATAKVLVADDDWLDGKEDIVEVVAADDHWQLVANGAGAPYYYNVRTGASSQEKPQPEWQRIVDDRSGQAYWYNATTGESQWDTRTATSELL